jgi:hypothetical protein
MPCLTERAVSELHGVKILKTVLYRRENLKFDISNAGKLHSAQAPRVIACVETFVPEHSCFRQLSARWVHETLRQI